MGEAIVRRLLEDNMDVRSFSRSYHPQLDELNVEQVQGDLVDYNTVLQACTDVSVVFHVAANAGVWGKYQEFYGPNVIGTQNIVSACIRCGVERLIYTSSPSVVFNGKDMVGIDESVPYPNAYNAHYPRTKALAEKIVIKAANNGLPAIVLRPHLIWGPGDNHLIPRIIARAHRLRQIGNGMNKIDTLYIDNAAHAHILAESNLRRNPGLSGRIYFISQDEPIALWEMINHILEAGGLPPIRRKIPARLGYLAGAICELSYAILGIKDEPPLTRFVVTELSTSHWFNIQAAKRELGYTPIVTTAEGLNRLRLWLNA